MSTFYLIRHGANDYIGKALAGRQPIELNKEGLDQVEKLAAALKDKGITRLYSSPIRRAVQTAEPLGKVLGLKMELADEFAEVDCGDWTDKKMEELESMKHWQLFNSYRSGTRASGGELAVEMQARMVCKAEALRCAYPNDTFAVTSHADPIKGLLAYYLGVPLDLFHRIEISPASYSVLRLEEWGAQVWGVNLIPY